MSERSPKVSIVTPSYNQATFLESTILSVLEQDYPNIEYLIIDGGSSDGSIEVIRRYEDRVSFWMSEPDAGQTDAINTGFERASGQIFAYLNSDDLYRQGAVREAVDYLVSHPDMGMVYGDADYIDEDGEIIGRFPASQTDYRRLRRGYVHIPQQATFFRAELWHQVGPLDPSFFFAMDYDLWVRIARLRKISYEPSTWAAFRLHGESKTLSAVDKCWPEMIRVHRRLGGSVFSVIYAKYMVRRLVEPVLPLRFRTRLWMQQWAMAHGETFGERRAG